MNRTGPTGDEGHTRETRARPQRICTGPSTAPASASARARGPCSRARPPNEVGDDGYLASLLKLPSPQLAVHAATPTHDQRLFLLRHDCVRLILSTRRTIRLAISQVERDYAPHAARVRRPRAHGRAAHGPCGAVSQADGARARRCRAPPLTPPPWLGPARELRAAKGVLISRARARPSLHPLGRRAQTNTYRMIVVATLTGFVTAFTWKAWHNGQKKLYDDFYATKK
mgnify:FL=1